MELATLSSIQQLYVEEPSHHLVDFPIVTHHVTIKKTSDFGGFLIKDYQPVDHE